MTDALICGIDAGGTKTDCAICSREGDLLARVLAGPGAMIGHRDGFEHRLGLALQSALEEVGAESDALVSVVVGLAGVDTPVGRERAQASIGKTLGTASVHVANDAAVALEAATSRRPAAVLMAGTGSIAYGEASNGTCKRVGGWGHVFGDEGSAFAIGAQALAAVLHAEDGRGAPTALADRACVYYELDEPRAIVDLTGRFAADPSAAASFSPDVFAAAEEGDAVAGAIIEQAARDLSSLAVQLVADLGRDALIIALAGGLLMNVPVYAHLVAGELESALPGIVIERPELPPVAGALLMGLRFLAPAADSGQWRSVLAKSFAERETEVET